MNSLIFPDINVWLAILLNKHAHRGLAKAWWDVEESQTIAFVRLTQVGVLRLLTTAAVMNGQPLGMSEAWKAYDQLFSDERVAFLDEPRGFEQRFRTHTTQKKSSPKLWADAWLLAFAELAGARLVTFDKALAARSKNAVLLKAAG